MKTTHVSFENRDGHRLAALLDRPVDDDPIAYALFAHCFTCSKDSKGVSRISRALARQGIGVLRFDFTGLGASEGALGCSVSWKKPSDVMPSSAPGTRGTIGRPPVAMAMCSAL